MPLLSRYIWEWCSLMGYCCKGICEEFKGEKVPNGSRYEIGQKRCSMCSMFLTIVSIRCPCCGVILRTKSRTKKVSIKQNNWR